MKKIPEVAKYLPELEEGKLPERDFFLKVSVRKFNSLIGGWDHHVGLAFERDKGCSKK